MSDKKKIGAKIVVDGEKEFRTALTACKNTTNQYKSELSLLTAQFTKNQNSLEALTKKQEAYSRIADEVTHKKELYRKVQEESVRVYEKEEEKLSSLAKAREDAARKLEEAKGLYEAGSKELGEYEQALSDSNRAYEKQKTALENLNNRITNYQTEINKADAELANINATMASNETYIKEAKSSYDNTAKSIDEFGNEVSETSDKVNLFGDILKATLAADVIRAGVQRLADGLKEVSTYAVDVGSTFEASMSNVAALSKATGGDLEDLTEKARQMGAATIYSASEAADAFSYMALAGWNTKQMLAGIQPVLNLAAAANMDLAKASDIVTDYLTAFGLEAKDAGHFADLMAEAMSTSNTTVELLGESYKDCAATAHSLGYQVEDVTAVLATMANAGVKGGEAGTALSAIMTRLATDTKDCNEKLEEYGVRVYDSGGNIRDLSLILNEMGGIWDSLTDKQQSNLAKSVAGQNHYSKLLTIMAGVSEQAAAAGQSFNDYAASLRSCDGAAEKMAATMQDNLKGKITIMKSALEGFGIAVYDVFDDTMKTSVDSATDAISMLEDQISDGNLGVSLNRLAKDVDELAEEFIKTATEALPGMIDGVSWVIENGDTIAGVLEGAVAGYLAYKAAVMAATIATEGFSVALSLNPVGVLAAALAFCTVEVAKFVTTVKDVSPEIAELANSADRLESKSQTLANSARKLQSGFDVERQYINRLKNELADLNAKEQLSAEEKKRVKEIVDKLNASFEGLNLSVDQQTGKVQQASESWETYIDTQLKQAQLESVLEKINELEEQKIDNEIKLMEIQNEINDDTLMAAHANQEYIDGLMMKVDLTEQESAALEKHQEIMSKVTADQLVLLQENDELVQSNEDLCEQQNLLKQYMDENIGVIDDQAQSMSDASGACEDYANSLAEVDEQLQEEIESLQGVLEKQVNSFDAVAEAATVSKEEILTNLQDQLEAMQNWSENMDTLAERGINDGLLAKLANMGPAGAGYVQAFMDMTGPELESAGEIFSESLSLSDETAARLAEEYYTAGVNVSQKWVDGSWVAVEEGGGEKTAKGLVDSFTGSSEWERMSPEIRTKVAAAIEASGGAVDDTTETLQQIPNKMVSALMESSEWEKLDTETREKILSVSTAIDEEAENFYASGKKAGQQTVQGMIDGQGEVKEEAINKSTEVGNDVIDAINTSTGCTGAEGEGGATSSTKTKDTGKAVVQGITDGIDDNEKRITLNTAIDDLCTGIKSPIEEQLSSENFSTIGKEIGQGLATGIEESTPTAVAAAKKLAQSVESAAKTTLQINSPSKVFKRIGYGIPEGLAMGVDEKAYLALNAIGNMTQKVVQSTPEMRGEYSLSNMRKAEGYGEKYDIDQVINIYSQTDDLVETTRKFRESQKEAAEEW